MVAAFWDDLKTTGASKVLKYISDEYVIIEWLNMETYQYGDNQTFQALYNSITPSGDDEIKFNIKNLIIILMVTIVNTLHIMDVILQ